MTLPPCPRCKGKRKIRRSYTTSCPECVCQRCDGTGKIKVMDTRMRMDYETPYITVACPDCAGTEDKP